MLSAEGRCVVVVDFDNFYRNEPDDPTTWLPHQINRIISLALAACTRLSDITVRIYGGWLAESLPTKRASELLQAIASFGQFPVTRPGNVALLHGRVELANRLFALPEIEWAHTYNIRTGLPRIRLACPPVPSDCIGGSTLCPARALQQFTKTKTKQCPVPNCPVTQAAFKVDEQKMVDCMMACDILSIADSREVEALVVCSDDRDLMPSIALALSRNPAKTIVLAYTNAGRPRPYDQTLAAYGLYVTAWSSGPPWTLTR